MLQVFHRCVNLPNEALLANDALKRSDTMQIGAPKCLSCHYFPYRKYFMGGFKLLYKISFTISFLAFSNLKTLYRRVNLSFF